GCAGQRRAAPGSTRSAAHVPWARVTAMSPPYPIGAESRARSMSAPLGVRIHLSVTPSSAELEQARERMSRESCPRRYCWYWHTLAFDWDLSPAEGCEVAERHITRLLLGRAQGEPVPAWQVCCRASGNPQHADYYEPREPHLEADGWP